MSVHDTPSSSLEWRRVPELKDPFLVAGFRGWSDAGSVSSDTLSYLAQTLNPTVIATLSEEPFVNYTLDRPVAQIEDGIIHEIEPMFTEFSCWNNPDGDHDAVIVLAREPHYRWLEFASTIVDLMFRLGVTRLYLIGGVEDTISHNSQPLVTLVGSSPEVIAETMCLGSGIRPADYYGPISIHSCLIRACEEAGVEAVSFWAHVPAYLQKNPRLVARIVTILNASLGMQCPTELLERKSAELDLRINEALLKDPNLKRLVDSIQRDDEVQESSSTQEKVIRLDDFLRRDSRKDPEK